MLTDKELDRINRDEAMYTIILSAFPYECQMNMNWEMTVKALNAFLDDAKEAVARFYIKEKIDRDEEIIVLTEENGVKLCRIAYNTIISLSVERDETEFPFITPIACFKGYYFQKVTKDPNDLKEEDFKVEGRINTFPLPLGDGRYEVPKSLAVAVEDMEKLKKDLPFDDFTISFDELTERIYEEFRDESDETQDLTLLPLFFLNKKLAIFK